MYKLKLLLIILIFSFVQEINAQDSTKVKKVKILPVPALGYSPETRTYLGAVCLFTIDLYQDSITRSSNAKIEFNYTWRKQIISEVEWNYFFKEEAWFFQGLLHYSKYPDAYYGLGANSQDSMKVNFESNRIKTDLKLLKKIKNRWFSGLGLSYYNYDNINYNENVISYPELKRASNFGIRAIVLNDSRNNILTATRGNYLNVEATINFSEKNYYQIILDGRKYLNFGKNKKQVLAGRFYHSSVSEDPGFYNYSIIGGDKLARGYFYGRFRDQHLSMLQLEYRANIVWRIGLATFAGLSTIYNDLASISKTNFKPNAGIGLRFLVDKTENTSLRFDYAIGIKGESGFYVSFGESF